MLIITYGRHKVGSRLMDIKKISGLLQKAVEVYELNYYALFYEPNGTPNVIHTYPKAWVRLYLSQNYHQCDTAHSSSLLPVLWDTNEISSKQGRERELFERAADFQINAGYTTPI